MEALVLCADVTLQRVLDIHSTSWFRAYSLLQRCCPRLDLITYVEQSAGMDPTQQLVTPPANSQRHVKCGATCRQLTGSLVGLGPD